MRFWALEDRPREKLMLKESSALSTTELIAVILGTGPPGESALGLAHKLLNKVDGDLNAMAKLSVKEILNLKLKQLQSLSRSL